MGQRGRAWGEGTYVHGSIRFRHLTLLKYLCWSFCGLAVLAPKENVIERYSVLALLPPGMRRSIVMLVSNLGTYELEELLHQSQGGKTKVSFKDEAHKAECSGAASRSAIST